MQFQHPHMDITLEVTDDRADEYLAAGWLQVGAPPSLEDRKIADLRDEIAHLNEHRGPDDQLSAEGKKADLIATIKTATIEATEPDA